MYTTPGCTSAQGLDRDRIEDGLPVQWHFGPKVIDRRGGPGA